MKIRLLLATAALALAPGFAFADCAGHVKNQTTSQCMPGQTWDSATQSCTAPVQG